MKKIIIASIASIVTCSVVTLALATSTDFTSSDIKKNVEYTFKKGEDNLLKINEHFFVDPSKKVNFVTKFMDKEVNQNIGFQGEDILVSKDIPEGSYDLTVAICEEKIPAKEELNKTWEKEYGYFYDEGKKKENNEGEGDGEGGDGLDQDL